MAAIDWTESLSVNVMMLDNEHKKLIKLINNLHEAMGQGQGKEVLSKTLDELIKYTQTHFTNEQNLMQKHGYPQYETHKKEHETFVNKIKQTQGDYESGKAMISVQLSNFLGSWIQNHIMKTDQYYTKFFNEKGIK